MKTGDKILDPTGPFRVVSEIYWQQLIHEEFGSLLGELGRIGPGIGGGYCSPNDLRNRNAKRPLTPDELAEGARLWLAQERREASDESSSPKWRMLWSPTLCLLSAVVGFTTGWLLK